MLGIPSEVKVVLEMLERLNAVDSLSSISLRSLEAADLRASKNPATNENSQVRAPVVPIPPSHVEVDAQESEAELALVLPKLTNIERPSNRIDAAVYDYKIDPSNVALRDRVIDMLQPAVKAMASKFAGKTSAIDPSDLIQEGNIGLMDALRDFKLERGVHFETYYPTRVRGAMLDFLRKLDHLPRTLRKRLKVLEELEAQNLDDAEIAERLGVSLEEERYVRYQAPRVGPASLDAAIFQDSYVGSEPTSFMEEVFDHKDSCPSARLCNQENLERLCRGLNKTERLIMIMFVRENLTMKEIGESMDLSESRVSQMFGAMLEKVRARFLSNIGKSTYEGYFLEELGVTSTDLENRRWQNRLAAIVGSSNSEGPVSFILDQGTSGPFCERGKAALGGASESFSISTVTPLHPTLAQPERRAEEGEFELFDEDGVEE